MDNILRERNDMTLIELLNKVSFDDPVTVSHTEEDILVDCCKDIDKLKNSESFQKIAGKKILRLGVGVFCDLVITIEG